MTKPHNISYNWIKRNEISRCNLCLKRDKLTWDHIPPKDGGVQSKVIIESLFSNRTGKQTSEGQIESQNGFKIRSICKKCNNTWLGKYYDPTLNEFARHVSNILQSKLLRPEVLEIPTKPNRLIRAVIGHLVASKIKYDRCTSDHLFRRCFFDMDSPILEDVNVFFWIHPHSETIIIRDTVMPRRRGDFLQNMLCHVLKYYPVGFLVTTADSYEGLSSLTKFRNSEPDEINSLRISIKNRRPSDWPERVDNGNFVMGGYALSRSTIAKPKTTKQ